MKDKSKELRNEIQSITGLIIDLMCAVLLLPLAIICLLLLLTIKLPMVLAEEGIFSVIRGSDYN
ncbi:MAG: hypothetical protein KGV56_00440 [Gammaproteobacteria bacterium]|nr:hypothetical protein [Gammaproteobacteria bacterium]